MSLVPQFYLFGSRSVIAVLLTIFMSDKNKKMPSEFWKIPKIKKTPNKEMTLNDMARA